MYTSSANTLIPLPTYDMLINNNVYGKLNAHTQTLLCLLTHLFLKAVHRASSSFYRWGNQGRERLGNLGKIIKQSDEIRMRNWTVWYQPIYLLLPLCISTFRCRKKQVLMWLLFLKEHIKLVSIPVTKTG